MINFLFDLYGTLADIKTDEGKESLWSDFANTLGESNGECVRAEYLDICKTYAEARAHKFVEFDLLLVFEQMLQNRGIEKEKASEFARKFRIFSREKLRLFPCVVEMLEGLKDRSAGVYLVSNAQACFTRDELDELGLTNLFDGILISSDAGVKKPHTEIFDIAFKKFGLNKRDCIYVGNDLHDDILGAESAGLKSVYIETEQSGKYENISSSLPTYIVEDHAQMKQVLFALADER